MDDENGRFGHSITRLTKEAQTYFSRALAPLGLAPGMQAYLLALPPGVPLAQKLLADRLLVDRANVTRALKNFESRGWVTRRRAEGDAKEWLVSLTPSGEAARRQVEAEAAAFTETLRRRMTGEQWTLLTNLMELASGIGESREPS